MNVLKRERDRFEEKFMRNAFRERACTPTNAQEFIKLQMERVRIFLKKNPSVRIFPADKGGKVVIADVQTNKGKMKSYLELNTKAKIYFRCEDLSIGYVKEMCESKYGCIRAAMNEFFERDRLMGFENLGRKLVFEPFVMSRIYGLFKIHKEGFPVRPIINCLAK